MQDPYLSLSQDIFTQHNLLRSLPTSFIPDLESLLLLFEGNVLRRSNGIGLLTKEGPSAVQEAISFLKRVQPQPQLSWSTELSMAAQDHANDLAGQNWIGHCGSDGSTAAIRVARYCDWEECLGESLVIAGHNPRKAICNMLIDDGKASRSHRKRLFDPIFRVCGVGARSQKAIKGNVCVVVNYAAGIAKKGTYPNGMKYTENIPIKGPSKGKEFYELLTLKDRLFTGRQP